MKKYFAMMLGLLLLAGGCSWSSLNPFASEEKQIPAEQAGVNHYLWQGALDKLGSLPIEIEDKNGETLPNAKIDFDSRSAWGAQVEAEHRVIETYFYITILADGDMQEKELEINPTLQTTTHFVDNRRFPGTATRIWIRQVPAQKGRSGEDQPGPVWNAANLAADVNPTDEDFQWWRVNPYWAH